MVPPCFINSYPPSLLFGEAKKNPDVTSGNHQNNELISFMTNSTFATFVACLSSSYVALCVVGYGFASVTYSCAPPRFQPSGSLGLLNYDYYTTSCLLVNFQFLQILIERHNFAFPFCFDQIQICKVNVKFQHLLQHLYNYFFLYLFDNNIFESQKL